MAIWAGVKPLLCDFYIFFLLSQLVGDVDNNSQYHRGRKIVHNLNRRKNRLVLFRLQIGNIRINKWCQQHRSNCCVCVRNLANNFY